MLNLRGDAFWLVDRLRGNVMRAELYNVSKLMDSAGICAQREIMLSDLLSHATLHVPYYDDLKGESNLDSFPVVNKVTIRQHEDRFLEDGLDRTTLHIASTSGSTGTPFRLFHDLVKRRRVNAETIYWGRIAGYEVGRPLYHIKVWSARNRMSKPAFAARNIFPIDVATLQENDLLGLLGTMAKHRDSVSVLSYASALENLAHAMTRRDDWPRPRIVGMIGQSEHFSTEARSVLAERLGCNPVSRYGLEELGIVAQQVPNGDGNYLVNRASHFVEVLALDSDRPAEPGHLGRIVVTDLINRAQPLIRYDTGDLGAFALDAAGNIDDRWLRTIEGRRVDQIYDATDRPVSSMFMYKIWFRYPEIGQYQLIQHDRGQYTLRLNVTAAFSKSHEIAAALREYLGSGATVAIEFTNEDFVVSSGKRKALVSHYQPGGGK